MRAPPLAMVALIACGRSDLLELDEGPPGLTPGGQLYDSTTGDGSPVLKDGGAFDSGTVVTDAGVPPRACGPATCPNGCCDSDGTCVERLDNAHCGFFGEACSVCRPGDYCSGGCITPTPNCGPGNCAGCCAGRSAPTDQCADGIHGALCGHGGQECARCGAPEGTGACEPAPGGGGTCVQARSCTPQNCTGCCYGTVCAVGTQGIACGTGGAACQACSGLSCVAGKCQ